MIITINDVNEDPVITAGDTKASVAGKHSYHYTGWPRLHSSIHEVEDAPVEAATCTWSLKGTDAGDFNIGNQTDDVGQLTFKAPPTTRRLRTPTRTTCTW